MARGWGKSEEDLGAEKEQAGEERRARARFSSPEEAAADALRRRCEMTLARIAEELSRNPLPPRRAALEAARAEVLEKLLTLPGNPKGGIDDHRP